MVEDLRAKMQGMRNRLRQEPRPLSPSVKREIMELVTNGAPILRDAIDEMKAKEEREGKLDVRRRFRLGTVGIMGKDLAREIINDPPLD